MTRFSFAIERNSNSWHVVALQEQTRLCGDEEHFEGVRVTSEFDIPLGELERVIDTYGIENIVDMETANMLIQTMSIA